MKPTKKRIFWCPRDGRRAPEEFTRNLIFHSIDSLPVLGKVIYEELFLGFFINQIANLWTVEGLETNKKQELTQYA